MNILKNSALPCAFGIAVILSGCSKSVQVNIANEMPSERAGEIVGVDLSDISSRVGETFKIIDADKNEVPYQITYDGYSAG